MKKMNNAQVNNSQASILLVSILQTNNSQRNTFVAQNLRVSKFTALVLTASIMLGTVAIPTATKCDFKSSAIKLLGQTTSALGRFLLSSDGIKAIAASLFVAQNVIQFQNEKHMNLGTGKTKEFIRKSPLYLGHAGNIVKSLPDPISIPMALSLVNAGTETGFIPKTITIGSFKINIDSKNTNFGSIWDKAFDKCCEKVNFLKTIIEKLTAAKKKIFDSTHVKNITDKIQNFSDKTSWKFFTSKYGIKTIVQLTAITCAGLSFYNKENNTKSGATKTLPFYFTNTAQLMTNLIGNKIYETASNIVKIAIGEKLTKKASSFLPSFVDSYSLYLPKISY